MPIGNASNNAWEIRRYGEVNTYDGRDGVDSLSFDRLPRSYFTITQNADGSVNVDSVSGASALYRLKLISVELLYFSFGSEVVDLRTAFNTSDQPSVINGTGGNDTLSGTSRADSIAGLAGNDSISGAGGNDTLQGGDGDDTALFQGALRDYKVVATGDALTVTDLVIGRDGTDTLKGIEYLRFTDFEINAGVKSFSRSVSTANLDRVIELYVAFFNRIPDANGLGYWLSQVKGGTPINVIADAFYGAGVQYSALTGFSASMTNADFVNVIYRNVLGRKDGADSDGLAYWTGELASGRATRGSLVSTILDSAHTFKGHAVYGYVANLLDNKIAVAKQIAVDWGLNYLSADASISNGMAIAAAVSPTDTSAAIALVGLPSSSIDLGGG
jgi:serralysin